MTSMADGARPWRCFLAVPLPDDLCASLAASVTGLRAAPGADSWRWAEPDGWHLTLAFLGATPPDEVSALLARVGEAVGEVSPFNVTTGGLGGFPPSRTARVLWYGVNDDDGRLRDLAFRVQSAAGLDGTARFRPHVTLARARDRGGAPVGDLLTMEVPGGTVPVAGVTLFRSHLGHGPARYKVLGWTPLGGAVAAVRAGPA